MGIVDLIGFKWKLNKPFMTGTERQILKKLRAHGRVSSFRVRQCEGMKGPEGAQVRCNEEVPIINDDEGKPLKRFCSERCFNSVSEDESDGDDTDDTD